MLEDDTLRTSSHGIRQHRTLAPWLAGCVLEFLFVPLVAPRRFAHTTSTSPFAERLRFLVASSFKALRPFSLPVPGSLAEPGHSEKGLRIGTDDIPYSGQFAKNCKDFLLQELAVRFFPHARLRYA